MGCVQGYTFPVSDWRVFPFKWPFPQSRWDPSPSLDGDLLRISGRLSSMCFKLQTFKWKRSRKATCSVRAENTQDGNNLFMMQNSNRPPHAHTPPPAPPPPFAHMHRLFPHIWLHESTCFRMFNSPGTRIVLPITKGQQSTMQCFQNRPLSQHALRIQVREESSRVKNMQFIEPILNISLLSSTARRHEIRIISLENVSIRLEFQARESYRGCSYL